MTSRHAYNIYFIRAFMRAAQQHMRLPGLPEPGRDPPLDEYPCHESRKFPASQ